MRKTFAVLALSAAASPALAAVYAVDFERNWDFDNGAVAGFYAGGQAADGVSGPNIGAQFVNFYGLSNQSPAFTYFVNAPSPAGVAILDVGAAGKALMNMISASGVSNQLQFFYSSPTAITGAVRAFSGIDGTGQQLGSLDLPANDAGGFLTEATNFGTWTLATFNFSGRAFSFDFTNAAGIAGFDDIRYDTVIPVPAAFPLLLGGLGVLGAVARQRRQAV